uniref:BHLH domain-containing protein n=2 Tax=Oryza TaxID=4527 RepID=A0A0D3G9G9_9ORYZ
MADEHEWWNSPCSARTGDDEAACSTVDADESAVGSTPMSFGHGGQPASLSDAAASSSSSSFLLAGQHMDYWTQDFMGGRAAAAATASFDTLLQLQLQGGDAASRRLLLGDHAAAPPRHLVAPGAPYGGGGGGDDTAAPPRGLSPTPYEAADNLQQQQSFPGGHHVVSNTDRLHDHHQDAGSPSPATRSSPGSPAAAKKPRIEAPSPMPTFKVRKEKLGDRITALQQLVSPFGKTDTASVLHEAIEYIKFLHDQVASLSSPYLRCGRPVQLQHQQGSHKVNGNCEGKQLDLRSRGLCLVPVASTYTVASETATEFWHPTFGGTFR